MGNYKSVFFITVVQKTFRPEDVPPLPLGNGGGGPDVMNVSSDRGSGCADHCDEAEAVGQERKMRPSLANSFCVASGQQVGIGHLFTQPVGFVGSS